MHHSRSRCLGIGCLVILLLGIAPRPAEAGFLDWLFGGGEAQIRKNQRIGMQLQREQVDQYQWGRYLFATKLHERTIVHPDGSEAYPFPRRAKDRQYLVTLEDGSQIKVWNKPRRLDGAFIGLLGYCTLGLEHKAVAERDPERAQRLGEQRAREQLVRTELILRNNRKVGVIDGAGTFYPIMKGPLRRTRFEVQVTRH